MFTEEEKERLNRFVLSQKWKSAKSYESTAPHQYCLLKDTPDREEWFWFVRMIFERGIDEKFFKAKFRYLHGRKWKFWSMDKTIESTDLINRALITNRYD